MRILAKFLFIGLVLFTALPANAIVRLLGQVDGSILYDSELKGYHLWARVSRYITKGETNWCPTPQQVNGAEGWDFLCPTYPGLVCSKFTFGITDTTGFVYTRGPDVEAATRYMIIPTVGCFANTPTEAVVVVQFREEFVNGKMIPWMEGTDKYLDIYFGTIVAPNGKINIYDAQECEKPTPRCGAVFVYGRSALSTIEYKGAIHEVTGPPFGNMWQRKEIFQDQDFDPSRLKPWEY